MTQTPFAIAIASRSASTERGPPLMTRMAATMEIDWGQALTEHGRWLRAVVLARVRESQAVEEVMQNVALAACEQSRDATASLSDPAKIAPWLYRVAIRQALLYRRKQGRTRKLEDACAERSESRAVVDPLSWLLNRERQELVRQALASLSARDAEVLMLKYAENWSYRELAQRLDLSEAAIEARLHRARSRLRQALTQARALEIEEGEGLKS